MENHPSRQNRYHRFQAQDQGSDGGITALLPDDLEGISHSAGEDSRIENGQPCLQDIAHARCFQQKHGNCRQSGRYKKLDAGQLGSADFHRKVIHDHNVDGKTEGADQDKKVSFAQGKASGHTQKIQTHQRDHHADPDAQPGLPFQKDSQYGHKDDIQSCDKSCLAHRGVLNAHLLKRGGNKKHQAAETAAYE